MKSIFVLALSLVSLHQAFAGDPVVPYDKPKPVGHGDGMSRILQLMNAERNRPVAPAESTQKRTDPKSRSRLGFYLDAEFRGARAPADSFGGERALSKPGLIEIYGDDVDSKIDRMESVLLKRCSEKTPNERNAESLKMLEMAARELFLQDHNLKNRKYGKQTLFNAAREMSKAAEASSPLRRLALIAFMIRENSERRAQRIPQKVGEQEPLELALGSFKSEFWENFAGPLDGEHAHERLRLRSQGPKGKDLLSQYDRLVESVYLGMDARKKAGTPGGGFDADEVIQLLSSLFSRGTRGVCEEDSEEALKVMERFAWIVGELNWTEQNRGRVLDFILGEKSPPPGRKSHEKLFHLPPVVEKKFPDDFMPCCGGESGEELRLKAPEPSSEQSQLMREELKKLFEKFRIEMRHDFFSTDGL
jgi:hypothetical protein